jgi:thiamine biosynthesis lipoprotein
MLRTVQRTLLALAMLLSCDLARAEWFTREEAIMGTRVAVELWADDQAAGEAAIAAVLEEMRRIDRLMSHYRPDSELSRINAGAASHPVAVDRELALLIQRALEFSVLSDGAFDITYASVGYLYDYRAHRHPSQPQIDAALPAINWRHVVVDLDRSTVRYTQAGVRIDLGGIAKGYACDRAAGLLRARGIAHAIVTAGGDSRILGDRRGRPWVVGIRHPDDASRVVARLPLEDAAISTSGDYERFFDEGGVRYHHIIDPRTGRSAGAVRSVTVIADDATTTEGLTKSVFVKGPVEGLALINRLRRSDARYADIDAVIIDRDGRVLYSDGLGPPR